MVETYCKFCGTKLQGHCPNENDPTHQILAEIDHIDTLLEKLDRISHTIEAEIDRLRGWR